MRDLGELEGAIRNFYVGTKLEPSNHSGFYEIYYTYSLDGRHQLALEIANKISKLDPTHPLTLNSLSCSLIALGRFEEAKDIIDQGMKVEPTNPESHWRLGEFYLRKKEYTRAIECYDAGLKLRPGHTPSLIGKAFIFSTCKDAKIRNGNKAKELARSACEAFEWRIKPHLFVYSLALAEAGEFDKALEVLDKIHLLKTLGFPVETKECYELLKKRVPCRY